MGDRGEWAACIEGHEEDGYKAASTRVGAIEILMDGFIGDAESGLEEAGIQTVMILSGCTWHERCKDEYCQMCESSDEFEFWLISRETWAEVEVDVYVDGFDEDGPCFAWREVSGAD